MWLNKRKIKLLFCWYPNRKHWKLNTKFFAKNGNLPVAKIVLISKCDPFWITNPSVEQPANPYRLCQHFVAMLAAFDSFAYQQHCPMPLNSADPAVHWNPPKRVNSLNMPWLIEQRKVTNSVSSLLLPFRTSFYFAFLALCVYFFFNSNCCWR